MVPRSRHVTRIECFFKPVSEIALSLISPKYKDQSGQVIAEIQRALWETEESPRFISLAVTCKQEDQDHTFGGGAAARAAWPGGRGRPQVDVGVDAADADGLGIVRARGLLLGLVVAQADLLPRAVVEDARLPSAVALVPAHAPVLGRPPAHKYQ